MLYSEEPCAMAIRLIASLPKVLKTRPAMPGEPAIFSPTAATMADVSVHLDVFEVVLVHIIVERVAQRFFCARGIGGLHNEADTIL